MIFEKSLYEHLIITIMTSPQIKETKETKFQEYYATSLSEHIFFLLRPIHKHSVKEVEKIRGLLPSTKTEIRDKMDGLCLKRDDVRIDFMGDITYTICRLNQDEFIVFIDDGNIYTDENGVELDPQPENNNISFKTSSDLIRDIKSMGEITYVSISILPVGNDRSVELCLYDL